MFEIYYKYCLKEKLDIYAKLKKKYAVFNLDSHIFEEH